MSHSQGNPGTSEDDAIVILSDDSEHEEEGEDENHIDRERYKLQRILGHDNKGSLTRYLVQFKGKEVKGDIRRVWLNLSQLHNRAALEKYRKRLNVESRLRSQAKTYYQMRRTSKAKPAMRDSSTQVESRDYSKQNIRSKYSLLAPANKIKLVFNQSTQTELTYFVWHTN